MQPNPQAAPELTWNEFCSAVRHQLRRQVALPQCDTELREWHESLQKQWARAESKIQKSATSD